MRYFILLVLVIGFVSCKKEDPFNNKKIDIVCQECMVETDIQGTSKYIKGSGSMNLTLKEMRTVKFTVSTSAKDRVLNISCGNDIIHDTGFPITTGSVSLIIYHYFPN